jgi:hypothetical protein
MPAPLPPPAIAPIAAPTPALPPTIATDFPTELRFVQKPNMQPNEVPWTLHPILSRWYANIPTHELGRRIVIDAIARAGYFESDQ